MNYLAGASSKRWAAASDGRKSAGHQDFPTFPQVFTLPGGAGVYKEFACGFDGFHLPWRWLSKANRPPDVLEPVASRRE